MQPVSFNSQGCLIQGHLYLPPSAENASTAALPTILLAHGFCGVKELLLPAFAQYFAAHGYAALTFDYRGFGESEGEAGRLVPQLQIEDIHAAIDYLSELPQVDAQRIGLWGSSFGGANVIIAGTQTDKVKCICAQLTFGDGERVITGEMTAEEKQKFVATLDKMQAKKVASGREMMVPIAKVLTDPQSVEFYQTYKDDFPALTGKIPFLTTAETMSHKPELVVDQLNKPLLIVAADQDGVNPLSESESLFAKANEPKQLYIEQGATHYEVYTGEHFERVAKIELEWFNKFL